MGIVLDIITQLMNKINKVNKWQKLYLNRGGLLIRIDVKQLLARINNISTFSDIKWINISSGTTNSFTQEFDSAMTSGIIEIKIPRTELLEDNSIDPDGIEIELEAGSSKLDLYYIYCYYTITNDSNTKYSSFVVPVPNGAWALAIPQY